MQQLEGTMILRHVGDKLVIGTALACMGAGVLLGLSVHTMWPEVFEAVRVTAKHAKSAKLILGERVAKHRIGLLFTPNG